MMSAIWVCIVIVLIFLLAVVLSALLVFTVFKGGRFDKAEIETVLFKTLKFRFLLSKDSDKEDNDRHEENGPTK